MVHQDFFLSAGYVVYSQHFYRRQFLIILIMILHGNCGIVVVPTKGNKALANEDTLLWIHSSAHDVSWAGKHAGHEMNVVFLCCANWETFVADTKCF